MSLTRGDAHAKNHQWLTPRRYSLCSDEDHLSPATSLVLPDRRDSFENFKSIRHGLQQLLEIKGFYERNQCKLWCSILAVLKVVCAPALFGNVVHVALWGGSRFAAGCWRSRVFLKNGGVEKSFPRERRYKRAVRIAVDRCFPPKSG